jgi:hypothetical protein
MASSTDPPLQMSDEVHADYDPEPLSRTSSQSAASISNTSASSLVGAFDPTKYFFIHARGLPVVRVPGTPSHDTTIKVTDSSGATIFTSERPSRWSAVTSFHSASGETLGKMTGGRFSNFPLRVIELYLLGNDGKETVNDGSIFAFLHLEITTATRQMKFNMI